jgi:short chain dehydrogenase
VQIGRGVAVELQGSRERVEDLRGWMLVESLLQAHVVVAADAGQHRDFLAAQPGHPAAAAGVGDADVLRRDQLAPGAQVFADQVVLRHEQNVTPRSGAGRGPATTRTTRSLVPPCVVAEARSMTNNTSPGLIQTRFGFDSTAAEVIEGIDLSGRRAIVTGGSSGIGMETARALASAGAEVTLAVRDTSAGGRAAASITDATGKAVHVSRRDLASQSSVAAFAAGWTGPLDLLINNAGLILAGLRRTADGW